MIFPTAESPLVPPGGQENSPGNPVASSMEFRGDGSLFIAIDSTVVRVELDAVKAIAFANALNMCAGMAELFCRIKAATPGDEIDNVIVAFSQRSAEMVRKMGLPRLYAMELEGAAKVGIRSDDGILLEVWPAELARDVAREVHTTMTAMVAARDMMMALDEYDPPHVHWFSRLIADDATLIEQTDLNEN